MLMRQCSCDTVSRLAVPCFINPLVRVVVIPLMRKNGGYGFPTFCFNLEVVNHDLLSKF